MMEMLTPISEYLWSCSALYINRYAWKYYSACWLYTTIEQNNGDVPLRPNAAVSKDLLLKIQQW